MVLVDGDFFFGVCVLMQSLIELYELPGGGGTSVMEGDRDVPLDRV